MKTLPIRAIILALVLGALPSSPALAQDDGQLSPLEEKAKQQKQNLPSAESIFERYVEAIGGREKLMALRNRVHEGLLSESSSGAQKWLTMTYVAPNKLRIEIEEPGGTTYDIVYDGEIAWLDAGEKGQDLLLGPMLIDLSNDADFYGEANYKERYLHVETEVQQQFKGRDAYYVKYRTRLGSKPGYSIFDVESGLLLGTRTFQAKGEDVQEVQTYIAGYKEYEGVLLPTEIVQTDENGDRTTFVFRRTRVNVPDPATFERPEAIEQKAARLEETFQQQKQGGGG